MKKIVVLLMTALLLLSFAVTSFAADGKVTYSGNAGDFVFEPGSDQSLTDLFPNFKDVMPGDSLTQKITVKNDADRERDPDTRSNNGINPKTKSHLLKRNNENS